MTTPTPALQLGLLGSGIAHSLSPTLHRAGLAALGLSGSYALFEAGSEREARARIAALREGRVAGLNVTTPFKRLAAALVDEALDVVAARSANTLWVRDGRLLGGSSDGPGLLLALGAAGVDVRGCRVGVLGAGGVAAAVTATFVAAGATIVWVVARDAAAGAAVADACGASARPWHPAALDPVDLCIHATRIGHGARDERDLQREERIAVDALGDAIWRQDALLVDLVVARAGWTPLQRRALDAGWTPRFGPGRGVLAQSGAAMLAAQAAISLGWWTGREPPLAAMAGAIGVSWIARGEAPGT